ncbi:MAG: potassium transporter Kup [Nitrospirae bacterium]|nr:MAG: potassium transporter Kup [Nitrospirota bacterium]
MAAKGTGRGKGREGRMAALMLAALGVVYGDIGTSPLYAFRECFAPGSGLSPSREEVLGVLSLIVWSLMLVLSVKYVALVMRADDEGEGGILALMSLLRRAPERPAGPRPWLVVLGLFGAALLYGDGMITPAISVLSAVEGLSVATPAFDRWLVPITVAILCLLFWAQHKGTGRIGALFGPVILLWFLTLGVSGAAALAHRPGVLAALLPHHALRFLLRHRLHALVPLGAVFLAVTGAEALYADMGHFGAAAIRRTWFAVVLPCLLLNYLGQGALLLARPEAAANPFFHLVPRALLYPTVGLACLATVIASQAVISGAFSLTRQAVRLDYLPRLAVVHTSPEEEGQVYLPSVNRLLFAATVALAVGFGTSSGLAAAYGIAVATTMLITTLLLFVVMRERWGWPAPLALAVLLPLGALDLLFLAANGLKIRHGGWIPLLVGLAGYVVMSTWRQGRELLGERIRERAGTLAQLRRELQEHPPARVPGTAVFLSGHPEGIPATLLQNLRHNRVLHEQNVILTLVTDHRPRVPREERIELSRLTEHIHRVVAHYGYQEDPSVFHVLARLEEEGLPVAAEEATFFLGRETLYATERPGMPLWRERLFALIARNALPARRQFHIPPERAIELGSQIEL